MLVDDFTNLNSLEKEDCSERKHVHIGKITEPKRWQKLVSTALAAAAVIGFSSGMPSVAELNKYEADTRGEFGIGSAAQYGSADLRSLDFEVTILSLVAT